jgi:formylglycine-generating enzyme required for sulfatase activity
MRTLDYAAIALLILHVTAEAQARALVIELVPVTNEGNEPDPETGLGAVAHFYEMGRFEVTNAEYVVFLNAVAGTDDPHGLWNPKMETRPEGGIRRSGEGTIEAPYLYETIVPLADKPVNFISWQDSARFVNWLENDQSDGADCNACTEQGSYDLAFGPEATRAAGIRWVLPTEDEWYKAAYHSADDGDGDPGYWLYPTQSDLLPIRTSCDMDGNGTGVETNACNYDFGCKWNSVEANVATVGSTGGASFYGTSDQGGNVEEFLENGYARGGNLINDAAPLRAADNSFLPPSEQEGVGFRLVRLPEPSHFQLHAVCMAAVILLARRKRRA